MSTVLPRDFVSTLDDIHLLLWYAKSPEQNKGYPRRACYFCQHIQERGVKKCRPQTGYACNICKVPFCFDCFSIFHHHSQFEEVKNKLVKYNRGKSISLENRWDLAFGERDRYD